QLQPSQLRAEGVCLLEAQRRKRVVIVFGKTRLAVANQVNHCHVMSSKTVDLLLLVFARKRSSYVNLSSAPDSVAPATLPACRIRRSAGCPCRHGKSARRFVAKCRRGESNRIPDRNRNGRWRGRYAPDNR